VGGLAGVPVPQIEPVQDGLVRDEGIRVVDVEDIRLGLGDAHRELVESVHRHGLGRDGPCDWGDVPELLLQDLGDQDRIVGPDREILQKRVLWKDGYGGELGQRRCLRLHDFLQLAGSPRC
jgi:hypothetical protein